LGFPCFERSFAETDSGGKLISYALDENPFIDFISSKLTADPKGFIGNAEMLDFLDDFFKENGLTPLSGNARKQGLATIFDLLYAVCFVTVRNVRVGPKN
jgi:hypothetical protein